MARAALQWGVRDLANAAEVSTNTVTRLERGETLYPRTVAAIRSALEAAGVIFLDEGETPDGGPGVRLNRTGDVPPQTHGIGENGGGPGVRLRRS